MDKKKILITGAGGFIGSALTLYLDRKQYSVIAFDMFYFGKKPLKGVSKNVTIVKGDIRKFPLRLLSNVYAVIHLASISNDPTANIDSQLTREVNTKATDNLAKMAKQAGVKRFIFASSSSVYDTKAIKYVRMKKEDSNVSPLTVYSKSKLLAEEKILPLEDKDFSIFCLRKGTMFGYSPRMRYDLVINAMIKSALTTGEIRLFCKGKQWRPLMSITDIVKIYTYLITVPKKRIKNRVINVALENYRIADVGEIVRKTLLEKFGLKTRVILDDAHYTNGSYKMSLRYMKKYFGKLANTSIEKEITTIMKHSTLEKNFENPLYYNIKTMKPFLDKPA